MTELNLAGLPEPTVGLARPFLWDAVERGRGAVSSAYVVGSALTSDYHEGSDLNTCFVLDREPGPFLAALVELGRRYSGKGFRPPLVLTQDYIRRSLDVFPAEFLDLKHFHCAAYGPDEFADLPIQPGLMRLQLEREFKTRLLAMQQVYLSTLCDGEQLGAWVAESVTAYFPLLRGMLFLKDLPHAAGRDETLASAAGAYGLDPAPFRQALALRYRTDDLTAAAGLEVFRAFMVQVGRLMEAADALEG